MEGTKGMGDKGSKRRKRGRNEAFVNAIIRAVPERESHRAVSRTSCFMEYVARDDTAGGIEAKGKEGRGRGGCWLVGGGGAGNVKFDLGHSAKVEGVNKHLEAAFAWGGLPKVAGQRGGTATIHVIGCNFG